MTEAFPCYSVVKQGCIELYVITTLFNLYLSDLPQFLKAKACPKHRVQLSSCSKLATKHSAQLSFCLKFGTIVKKLKLVQNTVRICRVA